MRWARFAVGVSGLAVGLVIAGCSRGTSHSEGTLRQSGDVRIAGIPIAPSAPVRLKTGDIVSVRSGEAVVSLPSGGQIELRPGSLLKLSNGPVLIAGDLLARSSSSAPVKVTTPIGDVIVQGIARLHRDLALAVGTYSGRSTVSAARTLVVPALTQETIASVGFTPEPTPLHLDATDAWDERYLGTAIDLTDQLDGQSRYVTANTPAGFPSSLAFYNASLGSAPGRSALNEALLRSVSVSGRSPAVGDGLAAAAIALAGPGDFATRWREVFSLRARGAQWGVIALQELSNPATVLRLVETAVSSSEAGLPTPAPAGPTAPPLTQLAAPAPLPPVAKTTPSRSTTLASGVGSSSPSASRSGTKSPTTTTPPASTPPTPPTTNLLAPIVNPVGKLLHDLLGGSKP